MRKVVSWALAMTFLLGFAHLCLAQKPQPVVTICFSGYDELMKDVDVLGKLGNMPQLSKMLEGGLQSQEPGRLLLSVLDKSKPWGAVLSMAADNPQPVVQVVLPITDVKTIVKVLQATPAAPRDIGGGDYELQAGPRTIVFRQKGTWMIVATSKQDLDAIPADPATLLGGLNQKYTAAISFGIKNIPPQIRDQAMIPLRMMLSMGAPGPAAEQAMNQITETLKDLDTVLFGLAMDRSANAARLELVTTMQPGSKLAQRLAQMGDVKTDMAGLADPSAAVLVAVARKVDADEIAQAKANLAGLKQRLASQMDKIPPPDDQLAKQLADTLFSVVEKTLEGGKIDGGLIVNLAPKSAQLVGGLKIAQGAKLNDSIKLVLARATQMAPEAAQMLKVDAETYQGIHFHVISVPVAMVPDPQGKEILTKLFGDKAELALGIGDDSAYIAISSDAAKTLKGVIDKSKASPGKSAQPLQASIAVTPIARAISDIGRGGEKKAADMMLQLLSSGSGSDHIKLTVSLIPNGSKVQLDVEEGVLRLIAAAVSARQQSRMGGSPRP